MEHPELDKDEKIIPVRTRYENYNSEMIFGSKTKEMYINVPPIYNTNEIESSKIVMSDSCDPNEFNDNVIVLYEVGNNFNPPKPY